MIKVFKRIMEEASKGMNVKALNQQIMQKNVADYILGFSSKKFKKNDLIQREKIELNIVAYNSYGYETTINKENLAKIQVFFVLRMQVNDIKSCVDGRSLGSLLFAESFIMHHNAYYILTAEVPRFSWWETEHKYMQTVANMRKIFTYPQLGKMIKGDIGSVRVFLPFRKEIRANKFEGPMLEGNVHFHSNGLRIFGERHICFTISFEHCSEIFLFNQVSTP